ncbi:hypothetical protein [Lacrimispora sp.]|uniref:hypothetical protein n=1 Tax=Lacrimispora sp. TaxID=2719234 RepID=UPI00346098A6
MKMTLSVKLLKPVHGRRASGKVQEIEIVYNFIGAFDLGKVIEQAKNNYEITKIGMA